MELEIDENCKNASLEYPLHLESEIRPLKCRNISSFDRKTQIKIVCVCVRYTRDFPVIEIMAKINASVPSDVLNRSKSIDYSTN